MKRPFGTLPLLAFFAVSPLEGIKIELRYDYDESDFFDQAGSREAMRACADFFENLLMDELSEINPATSGSDQNSWVALPQNPATGTLLELTDLVVPADTLIIFPGARDLPGTTTGFATSGLSVSGFSDFFETVLYRGQAGAQEDPARDFGTWGGSISFDAREPGGETRRWNFSTTVAVADETNFVGVALHEIMHLLGVGNADSWRGLIDENGFFQGEASIAALGGSAPQVEPNQSHWLGSTPGPYQAPTFGSFGSLHGVDQRVLMSPVSLNTDTSHKVITDLDLGALIDIGWEVLPPVRGGISVAGDDVRLEIPTSTSFFYQVQQGDLEMPFVDFGGPLPGDGSVQTIVVPLSAAPQNFFRFVIRARPEAAGLILPVGPVEPPRLRRFTSLWSAEGCCHQ